MKHFNPKKTVQKLQKIQKGIAKVLAGGKTMSFRGQLQGQATLGPMTDAALLPYETVDTNKAVWTKSISDRDAADPATQLFITDMQKGVESSFGVNSPEAAEFGFVKKQAIDLTPEQKQLKLERMRATRSARKTMGRRQRAQVKGVVNPGNGNGSTGPAAPGMGTSPVTK